MVRGRRGTVLLRAPRPRPPARRTHHGRRTLGGDRFARGRRALGRQAARPGRVRAHRPGLGGRPWLRAALLRQGRDHVQGGPRRRAVPAQWPQRRRVRPADQLPPLRGPGPGLDRRDQLLRLQPQPGAVRRTERPAVPWQRQDLRQPRRAGGLLRRVPDPAPGRQAEQDREAEQAVAQRGGPRPQPVQLLLPRRLGDAERHLREARGPGAGLAAGRLLHGRRLGELAGRRRAGGPGAELDPRPAPGPPPRRAARPARTGSAPTTATPTR